MPNLPPKSAPKRRQAVAAFLLSGFVHTPQCFLAFLTAIVIAAAVDAVMITHNHRPETWQLTAEMVFDDGSSIIAWSLPATWPIPGP